MVDIVLVCDESSIFIDSFGVASCTAWQQIPLSDLLGQSVTNLSTTEIAALTQATIEIFVIAFVFKMFFRFLDLNAGRY